MKIAVLTLPLHTNYGGILQAYALQQYLKKRGHDIFLIDFRKKSYLFELKCFFSNLLKRRTIGNSVKKIRRFERNITMVKESKMGQVDLCIVGSDQVWRKDYIWYNPMRYFLNFVPLEIPRMSYAASFGCDKWEFDKELSSFILSELSKFLGVSVREHAGLSILKKMGVRNGYVHIDPTMLLSCNDYNCLCSRIKCNKYALTSYILDNTKVKDDIINCICRNYKKVGCQGKKIIGIKILKYDSIEEWLASFRDTMFVITDSFHGCVFSILYNKPFIVIANEKRGMSRFETLLSKFKLKERLLYEDSVNVQDKINYIIPKIIDWESVNKILQEERLLVNSYFNKIENDIYNNSII